MITHGLTLRACTDSANLQRRIKLLVRKSAAGLVEILAHRVRERGRAVDVEHRHAHLPRMLKK
jgi:hypothetical protein